MYAPETVTEALAILQAEGYVDVLELRPDGLHLGVGAGCHPYGDVVIDHQLRALSHGNH